MSPCYVWWLNSDCYTQMRRQDKERRLETYEYLNSEYSSREGRAGRGRLWISNVVRNKYPEVNNGIVPWPENAISRLINDLDFGGIVVLPEDLEYVKTLPGFVTDMQLNMMV